MRTHTRAVLAAFAAMIAAAAFTPTAGASKFRFEDPEIRATWTSLRFTNEVNGGGFEAVCPVTLEGTFHRSTFAKTAGSLVGHITRARLSRPACIFSGINHITLLNRTELDLVGAVVPQSLPWHIQYDSFRTALPRITSVRLRVIDFSFLVLTFPAQSCLYRSTAASPALFDFDRETGFGGVTEIRAVGTAPIPRVGMAALCPPSMFIENTGTVTKLGSSSPIGIALIQ